MIWFLLKCLGVIFIKIKIKGYLKNITDNEILEFEEKGIMNKNKITFTVDKVKTSIKIDDNRILMVRDGIDFTNSFEFNVKNSSCNYFLKENNFNVDIDIKTIKLFVNANSIYVNYLIVDSNLEYEYKLEMSEMWCLRFVN